MKYGYARVSTDDQKADLQIAAMKMADCDYIFTDTASGTTSTHPELTRCLASLRAGDILVVWKLDRLGRSLSHLGAVLSDLQGKGGCFPVAHRNHRHRKRGGPAYGAYPKRIGRV